jgi:hypothetical protein
LNLPNLHLLHRPFITSPRSPNTHASTFDRAQESLSAKPIGQPTDTCPQSRIPMDTFEVKEAQRSRAESRHSARISNAKPETIVSSGQGRQWASQGRVLHSLSRSSILIRDAADQSRPIQTARRGEGAQYAKTVPFSGSKHWSPAMWVPIGRRAVRSLDRPRRPRGSAARRLPLIGALLTMAHVAPCQTHLSGPKQLSELCGMPRMVTQSQVLHDALPAVQVIRENAG